MVALESTVYGFGPSSILVNGHELLPVSGSRAGYSIAALDPSTGEVVAWEIVGNDPSRARSLIAGLADGTPVIAIVDDWGHVGVMRELQSVGSAARPEGDGRWCHALIGVKGASPGTALERVGTRRARATLVLGNADIDRRSGVPVFITGFGEGDSVYLAEAETSVPTTSLD